MTSENRLNNLFSELHTQYFGIGQRNDKISISSLLQSFISTHSNTIKSYSTFDDFIEKEFKVFCIGYFECANEEAKKQKCPLKWGLDQYDYYLECGKELQQHKQDIVYDDLLYKELQTTDKDIILKKGVDLYDLLIKEAKQALSPKIYNHYFCESLFSLVGVESTFRLMIQSPYSKENIVKGELYKYLYSVIFPNFGKEISVRLL